MRLLLSMFSIMFLFASCAEQDIVGIPPDSFELKQNFPNPFVDTTRIEYGVPSVGTNPPRIRIAVYNRFLDRIDILRDSNNHPAGMFSITWKPFSEQTPGLYYVELQQMTLFGGAIPLKRIAMIKR
jgi:hypothetical protein